MANNNVELSLKITADLNEARENISQLNSTIKETAASTTKSNEQSAKSWKDVYTAQTEAMNASHASMRAEQERTKAQEAAKKATASQAKETEKLRQDLDKLLGSIDPVTKKLSQLDAQEEKLRASHKAGAIDTEAFDDYLSKINEQREAIGNVEKLTDSTKKLSLNTKTARRDMFSMFRGLASGNMSLFGNNLFELGNATGKLPALFSAATLAIGATVGALYAVGKTITNILQNQAQFNKALVTTGNYAGTTAGQLEVMSVQLGKANSNYSTTRQIFTSLAGSGKLTGEALKSVASAASSLSVLTGKSADEAAGDFMSITDSATQWAVNMNSQYHFLDIATYQRIATLEKQGKTEEAIALASSRFDEITQQRIKEQQESLTGLERAWNGVKEIAADTGQQASRDIAILFGIASIEEKIADLEHQRQIQAMFGRELSKSKQEDLNALYAERDAKQELANIESEIAQQNQRAINAQSELSKMWDENKTAIEKEADAIEALRKKYADLWATAAGQESLAAMGVTSNDGQAFSGGQWEKDISSLQRLEQAAKQYNDQLEKTLSIKEDGTQVSKTQYEIESGVLQYASVAEKERAVAIAKNIDAQKAQQAEIKATEQAAKQAHNAAMSFVKTLETQANRTTGATAASRQAQIDAMGLSGDVLARANAANTTITTAENKKANLELQKQLGGLLSSNAAKADIDTWYNELISKFTDNNNIEGINLVNQLLPIKQVESNLNEITKKISSTKANQATEEQRIQAQAIAGFITEIEAQHQILELNKQTAEELASQVPLLEKIAAMPGNIGQSGKEALAALNLEVAKLNETTDALTNAFRNGLQNGISSSLKSLADGTYNLTEALTNLAQTVISSMADIAAQGLSSLAMDGMDSLFSSGSEAASGAIAATEMSTAITASSAIGATEIGTSITTATTIGATTLTSSLTAAFATGAATISAAIAAAGASNAGASAVGAAFATGGYVSGAGTSTSDSIPARLSNGEYVVNAAAVRRVGIDYLHAINRRQIRPFSTGGLAGNAPVLPSLQRDESTSNSPVIQQTLVLDSGEVMESGIKSLPGQRALMTFIRANSTTIKQMIG